MKINMQDNKLVKIFYNDQQLYNVVEADDEAGYVDIALITFKDEKPVAITTKDNKFCVARIYGEVRFESIQTDPGDG